MEHDSKRYCTKTSTRILVFIVLVFLVISLSLYVVIIPLMIRSNFAKLGNHEGNSLVFSKLNIYGFNDSGFHLDFATTLPPLIPWLPVSMKLLDPVFGIGSRSGKYVLLKVADMEFKLNQDFILDMDVNIAVVNSLGLGDFIKRLIQDEKLELVISSNLVVGILGGLYVEKVIDLNARHEGENSSLVYNGIIPESIIVPSPNEIIRQKYPDSKRLVLGSDLPDIVWHDFDLDLNEYGMDFSLGFEMENPTIATLDLPEITFGFGVNFADFVQISVSPLILGHGINDLKLEIGIKFVQVDGDPLSDLIQGIPLSLHGPIVLKGASFMEQISSDLWFGSSSNSSIYNLVDSADILQKSDISVIVDDYGINIPISLISQRFFPLPPRLKFPASVNFGIFGTSVKAMEITINPITIDTTNEFINLKTIVKIIPVNTWEAAESLSEAINPLISLNPSNSSVGIGTIKLMEDDHVFRWSESLLKSEKVDVPLSAICIECLLSDSSSSSTYSLPQMNGLSIAQLVDVAGFSISAIIDAPKSTSLQFGVTLGYFGISAQLQRRDFVSLELPSGIHLSSDVSYIDFRSVLLLSREPLLASNLQDALGNSDQPFILSLTGIRMGNSEQNSLKTFSKIMLELDVRKLYGRRFPRIAGSDSDNSKPFATLTSAALEIKNARKIEIGAVVALYEFPLSLSIGSISLNALLDNDEILSLSLNPVEISSQKTGLELSASLALPSGNLKLEEKLGGFVNNLLNSESLDDLKLFITGLNISPPGATSGSGIIDQFKDLKIAVDFLGMVSSSVNHSLIETSSFVNSIGLSSFGLNTRGIQFETLPKSALFLSANLAYDNISPIKIILPYFKTEIALQDVPLVEQTIMGINLAAGKGTMAPSVNLYFQQQDTSIQDHFAKLIMEMDEKNRAGTKVSLKGIYFGLSDTDRNELFSKIDVDVSNYITNIQLPKIELNDSENNSYSSEKDTIRIRHADFKVLPGKRLALDASIGLKFQAPISANVGILESGLSINNNPLLKAFIRRIHANFKSNFIDVDIGADMIFQEDAQTPNEVASLVRSAQINKFVGNAVKLNQLRIGYSDSDQISTFSKLNIAVQLDALIKWLNGIKRDFDNSPAYDLGLKAKKLGITFEPGSCISLDAAVDLSLPYNVTINVPFLDAKIAVDKTYGFRSTLRQIYITSSELSGGLRLEIQDSEELENKLGRLSELILNRETTALRLGIQGIIFGYSEDDSIMAFSQMDIELALNVFTKNPSSAEQGILMKSVYAAYEDAINLKNIDLETYSDQLLKASVELEFISDLNVIVSGFGHLSANIAIDNQTIVETTLSGLHLNPGSHNMHIKSDLRFVSSRESQIQVATLINDLLYKDPSKATQIIGGTGFLLGYSSEDCIKAFRKVKIGLQASNILNALESNENLILKSENRLKNLIIKKNHIDMSQPGAIKIGLDLSLLNFTLPVAAKIGYIGVNTKLEGADLACVGVNDFRVTHHNGQLDVICDIRIDIPGGEDIKVKLSQTVRHIVDNGIHNASVSANFYNLNFGSNPRDLIDTFALTSVDVNPLSYLPNDSPSPLTVNNRSFEVDVIYVDVLDSRRLGAEVHARLIGFPPFQLDIPYFGLSSHLDGEELLEISVNDLLLNDEGYLTFSSVLFTHKNLNAAQKIAYIVGDILFHRPHPSVPNKMNFLSVHFGSSEKSTIDIFENISLDAPMDNLLKPIDKIQQRPETWIELWEMKSKISATGLKASVVGKPFPEILPFAAKNKEAGATAKIGFGTNGTQTVVNIFFKDLFFTPGKPFTGNADIQVLVPEILPFLKLNLPQLFEWKDYTQNISVGWPVLTIGDPYKPSKAFDPFDQIFMDPPPLFLWTPLTFNPKLVNPFKNGLGLDVDIHVPNPGPLFADFGFLTTRMYHKGKEVATVTNSLPVVIKNKLNGGELFGTNVIKLQVRMHLSPNPFKAWEELSDIIHNFKDYTVDIESSTPELGRVEWLSTCFNHVPEYMTGQMVPMLISMLSHIKLKFGPWTITPPERFRRGAQMMLNKLDSKHIRFIESEVEVDSDHFMAQAHTISFSGIFDREQFEGWPTNSEDGEKFPLDSSLNQLNDFPLIDSSV